MILCFGCSFTDHTKVSFCEPTRNTDFLRWPKVLGKMLDKKSYNLAMSGLSNDAIEQRIKKELIKQHKDIEMVFIQWTEWYRFSLMHNMMYSFMFTHLVGDWLETFHNPESDGFLKDVSPRFKNNIDMESHHLMNMMHFLNYRYEKDTTEAEKRRGIASQDFIEYFLIGVYYTIQKFCEAYHIPVIHMQGVGITPTFGYCNILNVDYDQYQSEMIKHHTDLFVDNFIGWPIFPALGGFTIADKLDERGEDLFISKMDRHPNEKGHEMIAQLFYDRYKMLHV